MATTTIPERLLGYPELSAILGLSVSRLRRLKCEGNFPKTCGPGSRVLVHPADLDVWLASNRKAS